MVNRAHVVSATSHQFLLPETRHRILARRCDCLSPLLIAQWACAEAERLQLRRLQIIQISFVARHKTSLLQSADHVRHLRRTVERLAHERVDLSSMLLNRFLACL